MRTLYPEIAPYRTHRLAVDALHTLHVEECGNPDGIPVIFLHGSGSGASGYSNFKGNYPEFAKAGFRCFVPDILGYGLSSKPDLEMYDTDFFTSGIKALVDSLGLKNIILLGNSLGGALCLDYALKYPDEVAKLILMAPGGLATLDEYKLMPGIQALFGAHKTASSPREALRDADALVFVTEWKEFRSPDFDAIKSDLKQPLIFDGRNLYDPKFVRGMGIDYFAIGR